MDTIKLNKKQQEAVDYIFGPLLVLAGPGTGKTQLLSARIAKILELTDAAPQNILCLTFTENAALNMRERLASIIKDDSYDVHIATYHSFGSDIIRNYPHFFSSTNVETGEDYRIERPIDDLQRVQLVAKIIQTLPYTSPLIGARHYIKHVASTISELKRALYTPESLAREAENAYKDLSELSPKISELLRGVQRFPSRADAAIDIFGPVLSLLKDQEGIVKLAAHDLSKAMVEASKTNKSKPLTEWKNTWLSKDSDNNFILGDPIQQKRMIELAGIYQKYQQALTDDSLYDFDDMILSTIEALKTNDELRYTLQEKYQFVLLDEFQDTNAAQFELVKLLTNNPVNEGRPNIFAVGDDDQAIYAFQGASVGNMSEFLRQYHNVKIVNLIDNYRSHKDILHIAHGIAGQIESRLHYQLDGIEKTLIASSSSLPYEAAIERHEFDAEANEYAWVASKIDQLVVNGVRPKDIAVLAPQHKHLEKIVPFLAGKKLPIAYEKRENILQSKSLLMMKTMIRLLCACHDDDQKAMDELFPVVLSYDFYELPIYEIWSVNWQRKKEIDTSWAEIGLNYPSLAPHILFYLALGLRLESEPLEYVMDYLSGACQIALDSLITYSSPFKNYYFHPDRNPLTYFEMLENLSTIREKLRSWQSNSDELLYAKDFLDLVSAYETAEQPLINTHPLSLSEDSVQLMTTYKAKGLEYLHVFLLSMHDDVWGKAARTNSNKLALPKNLQHVRYQGSSEDELRRLLFVAVTRAKYGLYLTSHAHKDNGKATTPVKYLMEYEHGGVRLSPILPAARNTVLRTRYSIEDTRNAVTTMWFSRHLELDTSLKNLLNEALSHYKMSPTHLNSYIDLERGGPETFVLKNLLRFPQSPGIDGEFGSAVHYALEQFQLKINKGEKPGKHDLYKAYESNVIHRYIPKENLPSIIEKGRHALNSYLSARSESMFALKAIAEVPFFNEGVILGDARLSGKIDRLEIDEKNKTIDIVDYKTGTPHIRWEKSLKLLKYKQQLYFYKLLIEGSHSWKGYRVKSARLEFIEPNKDGTIIKPLYITFSEDEEKELKRLITVVWDNIMKLDIPDTTPFANNFSGSLKFIDFLVSSK